MSEGLERYTSGDYVGAEQFFDDALITAEKIGLNSLEVADSLDKLSWIYFVHKQLDPAKSNIRRALAIWTKSLPDDDPKVRLARNKLKYLNSKKTGLAKTEQALKTGPLGH